MEKKKTTAIIILLVVIIGLLVAIVLLELCNQQKQTQLESAISEIANALVNEPDDGTVPPTDTEPGNGTGSDIVTPSTQEFVSEKGVVVRLDDWMAGKTISSPVTITGEIPGNWSFEGSFPVVLVNWDGLIIAELPANLQGNWMTDDHVPFTVTLSFDTPSTYKNGALILRKDNPSGLPENEDAIEIPVTFE